MNHPLHILIVDDNVMMTRTLRDIIATAGHQVDIAHSGHEALTLVGREARYDCLLTDIKMPDMNGVELAQQVRACCPDLPVVFMTAYSDDDLIQQGLEHGAVASLTKPLDINQLLQFFSYLAAERSVIIIDDDPDFCHTLADILAMRDYRVETICQVRGPASVLNVLHGTAQVVLLDMKLGTIDGLTLLKGIRREYEDLPVVLITGYSDEMNRAIEAAMTINAHTVFYKPLQFQALFDTLDDLYTRELERTLTRPGI